MAIEVQTQVTNLTITATVTLTGSTTGPITAVTIGSNPPSRVLAAGTSMTLVPGTANQFTITVPAPADYTIVVTCSTESTSVTVTVP